ncbi:sugar transferase [Zobellia amurskyensis]|uniref:Sugar transferase n=1 Tax=Zobellia amurskyensis TaxID=248905 RepID=A0A7X2ZV32_9FLAO|nr:sugar transferase [Zobellia amurskyensis]MUH36909.1 sugar transferase [Zobellia amurskyensis]
MYKHFLKRVLDFFIALFGLIVAGPIIVFVIIFLAVSNQGDVFFVQKRPGKNEKIFKIFKFKTMNDKKDENGNLLPDELRLTPIGKFIRKTSLDELPQLLNVLKGEMSLIGPRPLLVSYLPLYSTMQKKRHLVRPGITGWAQVNGRNAISWDKKFEYDVWYVENLSFWLDLKIIFLTVQKVIKSDGISSDSSATMEVFTGNSKV